MGFQLRDRVMAGLLCAAVAGQPVFAAGMASKQPKKTKAKLIEMRGDARVLHALNRFTFGPRPGDVAAVEAEGLDVWFERQLNPSTIDDSALEARLNDFPAMRLAQVDLMQKYPNPAVIREMVKNNEALPTDPVQHAIYGDQVEFYKIRMAAKAAPVANTMEMGTAAKPAVPVNTQANTDVDPLAVTPDAHATEFYPEDATKTLLAMAPAARFAAILRLQTKDLAAFRRSLSKKELNDLSTGMNPEQKEVLTALGGSNRVVPQEPLQARLLRDIYSDRQLEAVMTDFWINHFNVFLHKDELEPWLLPAYERDVIRPLALGRFEDLLVATAKSPAMLVYLDNWKSAGPNSTQAVRRAKADLAKNGAEGLNENYARELMELHTLGVGGGYAQADVTQVAKVFTGWGIDRPYRGGVYQFTPNRHEPGSKTVLGRTITESGETEGAQVLHMLATSPATAHFLSTKLAVRFVSDDPPAALVDRMAQAYLASDGDIRFVLRTMYKSPEFWSTTEERAKVKTPLEFVVSAVRASGADVKNPQPLVQALDKLGMPLYGMQTPNGYDWKKDRWVSTGALVSRMNFALVLSGNKIGGVRTDWKDLPQPTVRALPVSTQAISPEAERERLLELRLLGEPASDRTRAAVLAQFDDPAMTANAEKEFAPRQANPQAAAPKRDPAAVDPKIAGMAGLLLGSPEFQRR